MVKRKEAKGRKGKPETQETKEPKKEGRKETVTPDAVAKLREVFLLDYNVEDACDYAKISKDAYYRKWRKDDKFRNEMEESQRGLAKAAKRAVAIEIIEKKNARLSLDYLKNKRPEEYRTKIETDGLPMGNIIVILPGAYPNPRIIPKGKDDEDEE